MVKRSYLLLLLLGLLFVFTACSSSDQPKNKIAAFTFTNEQSEPFGSTDLQDSIWIANFIFTSCDTVCPQMTAEMIRLQAKMKEAGLDVTFISFTVDPEVDTPKIMKDYMAEFDQDEENWHMLTGYSQTEIETFARDQFQTIVQKPATSNQVIHGTNFYLIDRDGYLINEYNYNEAAYMEQVVTDVKKLSEYK